MPRILVVTDDGKIKTVMNERVIPEHLDDEPSSVQLLERLAWAISDAQEEETRFKAMVDAGKEARSPDSSYLEVAG